MSSIFGGNTGLTYEQVQQRHKMAESLRGANRNTPRNVGEGIHSIARALVARGVDRQATRREGELKAEADELWQGLMGGISGGPTGTPFMPSSGNISTGPIPDSPQNIANDAMAAIGKEPLDPWADAKDVQSGIFAGESGGDYDALYGYSQRPGGQFAGVKPTDMTVAEVAQFTSPSNPYGQWVKGQVGRVATPVGAYQVVGSTLRDAVNAGVISPDAKFDQATQDKLGRWILSTQGTGAWEGYRGPQSGGSMPSGGQSGGTPGLQAIVAAMSNPMIQRDPAKMMILQSLVGKALEGPATMTPYQQAQMDMREREFQMRQAGTWEPGTNVDVEVTNAADNTSELSKKLAGQEAETWGTYVDTGTKSAGMVQDMEALAEIAKLAPQGPITGRLAEMFPGFSSAGAAFNAIVKRVAPTLRAEGSGSTSDIEYQGMLDSMGKLSNRPEANAAIIGMMQAKAELNVERSTIVRQYLNSAQTAEDARQARAALAVLDSKSIMSPEMRGLIANLSSENSNKPWWKKIFGGGDDDGWKVEAID